MTVPYLEVTYRRGRPLAACGVRVTKSNRARNTSRISRCASLIMCASGIS